MSRRAARYHTNHPKEPDSDSDNEDLEDHTPKNSNAMPFTTDYCMDPNRILHLFSSLFANLLESPGLNEHIQEVKKFLYDREYLSAFDNDDKRFAYAARWTPARALAYASLFGTLQPLRDAFMCPDRHINSLCIGGGAAAEVVGLGALFSRQKEHHSTSKSKFTLNVVDIADWSSIIAKATNFMQTNWLYDSSKLGSNFIHGDVLTINPSRLMLGMQDVITLLFTTNELFAANRKGSIQLLQSLNQHCRSGTLLLIAESAGSYSNIKIGTKQFPIQFLIDMVLVGKPGTDDGPWDLVEQSDSCWYRVEPREVSYPLKLENMRFFYRLYRKK